MILRFRLFILIFITELFAIYGMQAGNNYFSQGQDLCHIKLHISSGNISSDGSHSNFILPEFFEKNESFDEEECHSSKTCTASIWDKPNIYPSEGQELKQYGRRLIHFSPVKIPLFIRFHCWKLHL